MDRQEGVSVHRLRFLGYVVVIAGAWLLAGRLEGRTPDGGPPPDGAWETHGYLRAEVAGNVRMPGTHYRLVLRLADGPLEQSGNRYLTMIISEAEGDLINRRKIAPELKGLVDRVSVSLNAPNADRYDKLCRPIFGKAAYEAAVNFITECRNEGIEVEVTCLDLLDEKELEETKKIASERDASFRLRHLHAVG